MTDLIEKIKTYIMFLDKTYDLEITVCDLCSEIFPYFSQFLPYSNHRNHFCSYLKKIPQIQKDCTRKQQKIRNKLINQKFFEGTCHAGVGEYVFGIFHGDIYLGFISVGQFCINDELSHKKRAALCEKYHLSENNLSVLYNSSLRTKMPDINTIQTLITPLETMIELLYVNVLNLNSAKNMQSPDLLLNSILLYLSDNYTNDLTLDKISEDLHYSKSYLCHYFISKRNMSIMSYVKYLRIERAKQMLVENIFSVSDISYQIGFNDANYFTYCFKQITGYSPCQYKKLLMQSHKQ